MGLTRLRHLGPATRLGLITALACLAPGCATITGFATGTISGMIDGPAQFVRTNRSTFDAHPELWAFNFLIVAPLSAGFGALFGGIKGMAVDGQWIQGRTTYGDSFGTYGPESVWRPFTLHMNDPKAE